MRDDGRKGAAFLSVVGLGLVMTPLWPIGLVLIVYAACK